MARCWRPPGARGRGSRRWALRRRPGAGGSATPCWPRPRPPGIAPRERLAAWNRARETRAATAAQLHRWSPAWTALRPARRTWQDAFDTESWWEPIKTSQTTPRWWWETSWRRDRARAGGPQRHRSGGARPPQEAGLGVVRGRINSYFASAARVFAAERARREPVVMLGEAIDEKALAGIVARLGEAVGVSDGRRLIESAGPRSAGSCCRRWSGARPESGRRPVEGWLGVAVPLEPNGPWLWSISPAPVVRAAPVARAALWGTSGGLAVGALLLFISGPRRARARAGCPRCHGRAGGQRGPRRGPPRWPCPVGDGIGARHRAPQPRLRPGRVRIPPAPASTPGQGQPGDAGPGGRAPARGHHHGPLHLARQDWGRGHGRGLPRRRLRCRGVQAALRGQTAAPPPGRRRGHGRPVHRRGPAAGAPAAREHRAGVRLRPGRRRVLPWPRIRARPRHHTAAAASPGGRPAAR